MSEDHFTLDVDPDGVRSARKKVAALADALRTKGTESKAVPEEIGDQWTGDAARTVKREMRTLGRLMTRWAGRLDGATEALSTLADHYDDALAQLPDLNRKWRETESALTAAYDQADNNYDRATDTSGGREMNRMLLEEARLARTNARNAAAETRRTDQYNLSYSFGMLRMWLAHETRKCGTALAEASPFDVPESALEDLRRNNRLPSGPLDHGSVLSGLAMANGYYEERRREIEAEERRQAEQDALPQVLDDIEALQEALDDEDGEAVRAALEAIGEHKDDPAYASVLVRELGPEGAQEVLIGLDRVINRHELYLEDDWPAIEAFVDTVAHGVSEMPHPEFATYLEKWMDEDYGAKTWALIASSGHADGRVNVAALSYHSEVYNASLDNHMGPGLFPQIYHYAYADADMFEQWRQRSSGSDLADILQEASPEHRDDLLFRMTNISVPGGTMSLDQWQLIADTFGETLQEVSDRYVEATEDGQPAPDDLMQALLEATHLPYDFRYQEAYRDHVEQVVTDPAFLATYIDDAQEGDVKPSTLNNVLRTLDVDADELAGSVLDHLARAGASEERIAENLGYMLRTEGLLGAEINLAGVVKSLTNSAISATAKHPLTAPVMGVLNALVAEFERLEKDNRAWDAANGSNRTHNLLGFSIYVRLNGVPEEFSDWVEETGREGDEDAINDWIQVLKNERPQPEIYQDINNLVELIDEARDEQ